MRSGPSSFRRYGLRSNGFLIFFFIPIIVTSFLVLQPLGQFIPSTTRRSPTTLPASASSHITGNEPSQHAIRASGAVHRRAEAVGSVCSSEGQWNCMTSSWQRCAAGRWSEVVNCAKGTVCAPAGLTDDFHVQHDGSVDGGGGRKTGGSGGQSKGPKGSTSLPLLGVVLLLWAFYV
ncbi:hypothetical protein JDV02_007147 [Purpureocillium takamizusanense]|uniref:Uncharacterized protein n=1 Tax=Purpureocillium takamizusanense TaxID=2060973 RepID=A0A9Q8QL33_9HYPO|nr:uncharacterized protein JDV02_007147 [Purpureocillium takamizusanense]UNI21131.1 hypothetical protein JDV02_007147 [Purpureocillium takamizusanense]